VGGRVWVVRVLGVGNIEGMTEGVDRGKSDTQSIAEIMKYDILGFAVNPISNRYHHSGTEEIFGDIRICPKNFGQLLWGDGLKIVDLVFMRNFCD
jgi:hypothetical protein